MLNAIVGIFAIIGVITSGWMACIYANKIIRVMQEKRAMKRLAKRELDEVKHKTLVEGLTDEELNDTINLLKREQDRRIIEERGTGIKLEDNVVEILKNAHKVSADELERRNIEYVRNKYLKK